LAVIGSIVIGSVLLIFVNKKMYTNPYIVVLQCENFQAETKAKEYLNTKTSKCLVKSKTARKGAIEINLEVRLKDNNTDFINELSELDGVHSAVLVSYNGEYMG
jgi:hypothetical protein